MADLPRPARIYIASVLAAATIAGVGSVLVAPPALELTPVAFVLLICATIAQQFKVKSPKHQSYYTTTIFFFAAAVLVPPAYVILIILAAHGVELLRERYRWYIQAFNVANFVLCAIAAGAVFAIGQSGHGTAGGRAALFAALAGLTFVGLNHLLTALVIMWARGVPISRAGTMDWENLGTDIALMSVGALGSLLWLADPWLAPLCLGPLFLIYRSLLVPNLKEEARTTGRSRKRVTLANALLVGQVAFSFLLLVTAALFLRSIGRAYDLDPGFQTKHLAVFTTNPGQAGYKKPLTKAFYKDARERVTRMPDVESVSWASNMPLWARGVNGLQVEGREQRSQADKITTIVNTVDANYFETVGVAIASGRQFTNRDQETSTPVAIVNEKLAHDYWPRGDALGKRIQLPGEKQMRQIVGIARTASYSAWAEPPQLCVYVPLEQNYSDAMILYVRGKADPRQILTPVRREVRAAGPRILIGGTLSGREIVDRGLFQARMGVALLSVFGLLALSLASIGLYGIMAYSVNQRKREIGLRMAIGAAQASVLRLILKQGMSLVLKGVLIGFAAALLVGRLLSRLLYGVSASDPLSIAAAAAVLLAVALLACYLPARWASRVDPLVALREG